MLRVFAAPRAMLIQLEAGLELFLVLERMIIRAFARLAFKFDEIILGHKDSNLKRIIYYE